MVLRISDSPGGLRLYLDMRRGRWSLVGSRRQDMSQTIVIALFSTRHEGELARGFLDQAQVPAALLADDAGGSEPQLNFVRPARLMVRREDQDLARHILTEAGYGDVLLATPDGGDDGEDPPDSNGSTS